MSEATRSVVIVANHVAAIEPLVEQAGFHVIGAAESLVNGENLVTQFAPDVIVLENDLVGGLTPEALERLKNTARGSRILLIVNEDRASSPSSSLAANAIVGRDDLMSLPERLSELDQLIAVGADGGEERRTGRDRRQHQDWSKVGWEKRRSVRREDDRPAT